MKILIVEDDQVSALALRKALEGFGYQVILTRNGREAWEEMLREPFRVVISDWVMPEVSGLELCQKIRSHKFSAYVYFILLTSRGSKEDKLEGLRSGADDLLPKPMDPAELYARIEVGKRILQMEDSLRKNAAELQMSKNRLESLNKLLEQASRRFEDLFNGIPIACFTTDLEGRVYEWNYACEALYQRSAHEVVGCSVPIWELICSPDDKEKFKRNHQLVYQGQSVGKHERIDVRSDGTFRNILSQMIPLRGGEGTVVGAIIANVDITDRKEMENKLHREMIRALDYSVQLELSEQELKLQKKELEDKNQLLAKLAVTDGLTGLANHRNFRECLAEEFRNSKKNKTPLSLILLDIDCFKEYNDTYGHPAGDRVLQSLARVLTRNARESDLVARYGGEEFAVLLPHTSAEDSIAIAERLRKAVESTHWDFRSVTASFGVSTLEGQKITVNELIEQADKALYVSKNLGRNRVTHYGYRTQSVA